MTMRVDPSIREDIWQEKLNMELNYLYCQRYGEFISKWDSILRYAIALTSLSTLAFWSLIDPSGNVWKWLSAVSSLLAVINLTGQYQEKIKNISKYQISYQKAWKDCKELWIKIQSGLINNETVLSERRNILDSVIKIEELSAFHTVNKSILKKCDLQVRKNNGY